MLDEDPMVLKKKQSVIDVGQRSQLDLVHGEIRRNKEVLTTLRLENAQLQLAVRQVARGQRRVTSEEYFRREEEQLHNKLCVLKRSLNSVTGKKEELAREIARTIEETSFIMKEGGPIVDENSAVGQKIRALENRLDKCLIKHNEVNAIRRTYETLLERLQQEQSGFDTQLAAMEKTLQCKEKDLAELNSVASEATKGRDAAKAEVQRLQLHLTRERRAHKKDITERRAFVTSKREHLERHSRMLHEKIEKGNERRLRARLALSNTQKKKSRMNAQKQLRPEELEQQMRQRELYNRLKELTMSSNVTDVISKLKERRDANAQLLVTVREAESMDVLLKNERKKLEEEWEKLQQQNGGVSTALLQQQQPGDAGIDDEVFAKGGSTEAGDASLASKVEQRARMRRRVLEEFDSHLSDRQIELEAAQQIQDSLGKMLLDVDAGVHHLAGKIAAGDMAESTAPVTASFSRSSITSALMPAPTSCATRGEAIVELLRSCGSRLQSMLTEIREGEVETTTKLLAHWHGAMPQSNIRVRLEPHAPHDDSHNVDDISDDMADVNGPGQVSGSLEKDRRISEGGGDAVFGVRKRIGVSSGRGAFDDFPENEIHDRHELKMMSIATVERERKKAKKQLQQSSKEESP
ncbi:hypothetical protein TraAM80_03941 [Trypanosoma rangeli]|uniref:ODAD1 central coiled coil region domain-containing protein n=1 Tax=Trypanosoma rangeli TaxID=5698 RepID=A0A422NLI6_TRYRA|nr:uncharacterized protein TraAM80_03941 [Trypanosoma rangeli]RNF06368.1 hypothetical protein TraAM80_03941 [Trypanosoma rangeli]|eukprot:RNF06368.1 hypothetical protein TraAM80_03941 [Trypanosoma rangeli]